VLTVLAVALQQFTFPYVLTRGGPRNATRTPVLLIFSYAFQRFQLGAAAAVATLLFIILAVLGLAVALTLILSGARLEFDPRYRSAEEQSTWTPARIVAAIGTGVGLLVVLGLTIYGLYPWLHAVATGNGRLPEGTSTGRVLANTWLPPVLSALLSVVVAALAGFGIGWLRPLGLRSRLLLLVFAPWLFVGTGVLVVRSYLTSTSLHLYNTFLGLVPPPVVVPAVFVFTLLFYGLRDQPGGMRARATAVVPMGLLVFGVTWLVQTQDLLWQLFAAGDAKTATAAVALVQQEGRLALAPGQLPVDLVLHPVLVVLLLLCALGLQLGYLDRLALRVGRTDSPT
jgi:ABC-type glycerol-3-phosphate transport system permease component